MLVSTSRTAVVIGAALVASGAFGLGILAADEEGSGGDAPPGLPYLEAPGNPETTQDLELEASFDAELITTGGASFDPTILTKFIPGTAFAPRKGEGIEDDRTDHVFGGSCVFPTPNSGGTLNEYRTGVELPDGARIKRVVFFGEDADGARNILVQLNRTIVTPSVLVPGTAIRTDETIASFTTAGTSGVVAVASSDLAEETGSVSGAAGAGVGHRFHTLYVELSKASGANHKLCGVEVEYQVPISAADPGTVFHPIEPVRAFDSRVGAYAGSGILTSNTSRVISIKDGHDLAGVLTVPNVIPVGATAIAYNITITEQTGPNFVSVTPGGATGFTTAAINFSATGELGNAGIVAIDAARRIKVWGGGNTGSTQFVVDLTGYFAPPRDAPNMGN